MSISIPLSPDAEAKLRERAKSAGEDITSYAARLLDDAIRKPSLDELLAPVREAVNKTGMTEEELTSLLEKAKHDVRRERHRLAS